MNDKSYNGWTNHATWLVALHIDNDQATNNDCNDIGRHSLGKYECGKAIKDYVEDIMIGELGHGIVADLTNSYLSEVDWQEIGSHFLPEDNPESAEYTGEETIAE